tara:strand:+ start:327 stop:677 length:351 start_codon:yes stop_codon:yes gene_type:complete
MRLFYIYFKGFEPPQLLIDSPFHAQFPNKNPDGTDPEGPIIYLFVRGCKEVTGVEPESKLELFKEGLNYPFHDAVQGLAKDDLMTRFDHLMGLPPSAVEVVALESQCDLIRETRFK